MIGSLSKSFTAFLVLFGLLVGCDKATSGGGGTPSALEGVWVRTTGSSTETVTLSAGGAAKLDSVAIVGASTLWTRYEGTWTGTGNSGTITWASISTSTDGVTWSAKKPLSDGSYAIEVNGNVGTATVHGVKREYTKGAAPNVTPTPVVEVVAPVFSVPTGTYTSAQTVAISTATVGGAIRYTTDGTNPTASSSLYAAPLEVSATKTLKAVTIKDGKTSSVASVTITIDAATKPDGRDPAIIGSWMAVDASGSTFRTLEFLADGSVLRSTQSNSGVEFFQGTFATKAGSVTMTWVDARKGVDPSSLEVVSVPAPTTGSYSISGGKLSLTIAGATTVYSPAEDPSVVTVDEPVISPAGGTFTSTQSVTLKATTGASVYYTTNGTIPSTASSLYTGPISVASSQVVMAIAVLDGVKSAPAVASFTIKTGTVKEPSVVGSWKVDAADNEGGMIFDAAGKVTFLVREPLEGGDFLYSKLEGTYTVSGSDISMKLLFRFESDDGLTWSTGTSLGEAAPNVEGTYTISGSTLSIAATEADGTTSIETFTKVASIF